MQVSKQRINEIKESLAVAFIMLVILLPVRLVFVKYIGDHWLGSFGVVSAVAFVIVYFSTKNKLGWFGRAFLNQIGRMHKGKRRVFIYTNIVISLILLTSMIHAIHIGNEQFSIEKERLKTLIPQDQKSMEGMLNQSKDIKFTDIIVGLLAMLYIFVFRFDVFAVIMATLNDVTNNFMLHMSTIFLVEEIEIVGLLVWYKLHLNRKS